MLKLLAALPDFLLAGSALLTWIDPAIPGVTKVSYFLLLVLLEFIVIHSAAFMGVVAFGNAPRIGRLLAILGLGLFYTIFVGAFALAFHATWPVWAFWALVANRMAGVLFSGGEREAAAARARIGWAAGVVFYLGATFFTVIVPLPRLGITPDVIAAQHFTARGLWIEEPWRVLALATIYYTLQGVLELRPVGWVPRRWGGGNGQSGITTNPAPPA